MKKIIINGVVHAIRENTCYTLCGLPDTNKQAIAQVSCNFCLNEIEREKQPWRKTMY